MSSPLGRGWGWLSLSEMGWSVGGWGDRDDWNNWGRCLSLHYRCEVGVVVGWSSQNNNHCVGGGSYVGIGTSGEGGGLVTIAVPIVHL